MDKDGPVLVVEVTEQDLEPDGSCAVENAIVRVLGTPKHAEANDG